MTLTPVNTPPSTKRPRLTRAVSGPASITTALPTQFTLPVTQVAGFPLDKILSAVGTPVAAQAPLFGGYTVLTSPGRTELQPESNLTVLSSAAMQEGPGGPAIVKVVSPFQLVTLPTLQNLTTPAGGTVVALPVNTTAIETVGAQVEEMAEENSEQQAKQ